MNEVLNAIALRSSTRAYTDEKLTEEEIKTLVTAGLQAPTAANRQEVHFSVVSTDHPVIAEIEDAKREAMLKEDMPEDRKKAILSNPNNSYYGAPTVIFISADKNNSWGKLDAGIATENIALAAQGMGLGSLIVGSVKMAMETEHKEHFAEALGFPENYEFEVVIAVGHKNTEKAQHTYDEAKSVTYVK